MQSLSLTISSLRDYIWGPPLLLLILGTGLYLTLVLRGIQFRYLPYALKLILTRRDERCQGDISHFQALMTALAATIGIGNIAGVAIALTVGGVGSLFWMVIAALIGMATVYAEAFLAIRFRIKDKRGEMAGGPMYTIRRGLKSRWLAGLFATAGTLAALTTGNMVQANSMCDVASSLLPLPRLIIGALIALLVGAVLIGGIRKIGRVAGILVPTMALLYLAGGLIILAIKIDEVPNALLAIFEAAFTPRAAAGGFTGASLLLAIRMGVSRGLLASEAGLGSTPIAAAAAKTDMPGRQALISMTGAFLSVCILCIVTGLVLICTGVGGSLSPSGALLTGVPLTIAAFDTVLPFGRYIVILGALLFGYSTIIGWAYYGERCAEYLFSERIIPYYRVLYTLAAIAGAALSLDLVWSLADIANALMVIPNLISLIFLARVLAKETIPFLQLVKEERSLSKV